MIFSKSVRFFIKTWLFVPLFCAWKKFFRSLGLFPLGVDCRCCVKNSFVSLFSAPRIKLNRETKNFSRYTCNLRLMETSLNVYSGVRHDFTAKVFQHGVQHLQFSHYNFCTCHCIIKKSDLKRYVSPVVDHCT